MLNTSKLEPYHHTITPRCAACFAEHVCIKSSSLLNSKPFLAGTLTFAVAISISEHQYWHLRAGERLDGAVTAGVRSGSSGAGVAGGVRAAGAVLWALLHGPGNSLVTSLNVSVSQVSTGSGAVSLPMQPSSVQRLEEPLRAQREPLLSAALGTRSTGALRWCSW